MNTFLEPLAKDTGRTTWSEGRDYFNIDVKEAKSFPVFGFWTSKFAIPVPVIHTQ